jgi:MSHA biogenesis protein MshO
MTKLQRGFTLIELVVVIVITGIISAMVSMFIRVPIQQYLDAQSRAAMTDVADTALRRIGRDLRLALPNSVRVDASGKYIEFLLTSGGGRYLAEEDNAAGNILSFTDGSKLAFDVLGPMPVVAVGNSIVVYNLGAGISPADAYNCSASCNRAGVAGIGVNTVTMTANTFAAQPAAQKMRSPNRRFQVVSSPVSYGCAGGTLTRYSGYAIAAAQAAPPAGVGVIAAVIATGVTDCTFSSTPLANQRSALISLWIELQNTDGDEWITLFHQVHVDNSP